MTGSEGERPIAGEARLQGYLEELREHPPRSDARLVKQVGRHARWQAALRGPLEVVSHLGGALVDGVSFLLGGSRRTDR